MPVIVDEPLQGHHESDETEFREGTPVQDPPERSSSTQYFPGAAHTYEGGKTFLDRFDADEFSKHRNSNIYYPFASRGDWELASWLLRSGLSMGAIDSLLSLDLVRPFVFNYLDALVHIRCR